MNSADVMIVGGGAAGLIAAIAGKQQNKESQIILLERNERVGKKLIATGNGRCNFSNGNCSLSHYHGEDRDFVLPAFRRFSAEETLIYMKTLGIEGKMEEDGKIYPHSLQASSVLDLLRFHADALGVETYTKTQVTAVKKKQQGFFIQTNNGSFEATSILLATGGMASPDLGGTGLGYDLAKSLGHTITELSPGLVQIKTENTLTKALKGIKIWGKPTLEYQGKTYTVEAGEILFTEYGLSGPPILQLSLALAESEKIPVTLFLDVLPDISYEMVLEKLKERQEHLSFGTLEYYFTGFLHKKMAHLLIKSLLNTTLSREISSLTQEEMVVLAKGLKHYPLEVKGTTGWKNAQVTIGGVATDEVDSATMESKKVKGLFFCGEILDIHGDCGGYNLQWAWSSGRLGGECAVKVGKGDL